MPGSIPAFIFYVRTTNTSSSSEKEALRKGWTSDVRHIIISAMSDEAVTVAPKPEESGVLDPILKEMLDAGVFYGRTRTKTHPKLKPYITANRNGIEIINLEKALPMLAAAEEFLANRIEKGTFLMMVGTQPTAQELVLEISKEFGVPAVTNRWLGGTLTNFKIISKRIEYFKKLKADLAAGVFKGYTKKEQLEMEREAERLEELLGSMEVMTSRPDLLLVVDPIVHKTAVQEARRLRIPIIAFMNTDEDPDRIDYPVLGNTKSRESITWFMSKMANAIREGKKKAALGTQPPTTEA